MNPEKEGPKRRIVFSSVAAAQFKQLTGAEAPGEVDPSIKVPPVASELTPWERTKFGRMMGQVPKNSPLIRGVDNRQECPLVFLLRGMMFGLLWQR